MWRTLSEEPGRERGRVLWFNSAKGYGRILTATGEIVFVHFADIVASENSSERQSWRIPASVVERIEQRRMERLPEVAA